MNVNLAKRCVEELLSFGVREYVICPGARNAPLAKVLGKARGLRCHYFFEERSASFFALGRIKDTGEPVAVVMTSGTAVAECLPAVIEAYYSELPLIIVSADRPRRYRGRGAPQTIEQVGLFGLYCHHSYDIENIDELSTLQISGGTARYPKGGTAPATVVLEPGAPPVIGPLHLNICFDEPLLDRPLEPFKPVTRATKSAAHNLSHTNSLNPRAEEKILSFLETAKRPLVLLSSLPRDDRKAVTQWLTQRQLPIYAESMSHLRDDPIIANLVVQSGDKMLSHAVRNHGVDSVVRIGSVPTTRFWRDLEDVWRKLPVLSFSNQRWSGLAREIEAPLPIKALDHPAFTKAAFAWTTGQLQTLWDADQKLAQKLDQLMNKYTRSEMALVRALAKTIPSGSRVYLGNSLPIREWDLAGPFQFQGFEYQANRGANGIDGQISTFLGWSTPSVPNWAVVGDLTALYDLAAPWILRRLKPREIHIAIINNGGGKIFAPMFKSAEFENRHDLHFEDWARQFGLSYVRVEDAKFFDESAREWPQVLEIVPDGKSSERMNEAWNKAWLKI